MTLRGITVSGRARRTASTTSRVAFGRCRLPARWFVGGWLALAILWCADRPLLGQDIVDQRPGWLLAAQPVVKVQLVQGRISVAALEVLPSTQAAAQTADGREEILRMQTTPGGASINYTLTDAHAVLTFDVQQGNDVRIRRRPRGEAGGAAIDYRQLPRGPVHLEVNEGQGKREWRGLSLWHLLLIHGEPTRTHLTPLVEVLRPGVRVNQLAEDVRRALFVAAEAPALPSRDDVTRLVRQLDSPEYRQRQAADRALRAMGPGIGPHLVAMEQRQLSLEQRERIKIILDGLAGPSADTPERVVAWLAADPLIWIELLRDDDCALRKTALSHMVRLTGEQVTFDPAGPMAQRDQQIGELRRRFDLP